MEDYKKEEYIKSLLKQKYGSGAKQITQKIVQEKDVDDTENSVEVILTKIRELRKDKSAPENAADPLWKKIKEVSERHKNNKDILNKK